MTELTSREKEVLNTVLSAEIKKLQFTYGHTNERIETLYSLRDKLVNASTQWRSGTPTEDGRYLVYYREVCDGSYLPEFDRCLTRILRYRVDTGWQFPVFIFKEIESCITTQEVLYWMPLPKEPITNGTNAARRSTAPGVQDTENVQTKE